MIIEKINSYYFINKIKEHNSIKEQILNSLKSSGDKINNLDHEQISKGDFFSNFDNQNSDTYFKFVFFNLKKYIEKISKKLKLSQWEIGRFWFQQYYKNDFHNWHIHPHCCYSNVYFVELPTKNMATQFYDPISKKIIKTLEVNEGDLLTFPSTIIHRSDKIKVNKRKTIISFNINYQKVDL